MNYLTKKSNVSYFKGIMAFIVFLLVVVAISIITDFNADINTWQNFATYDYDTDVVTDEFGNETFVIYIETPQQLAGALSAKNEISADSASTISSNYVLLNDIDLSGKTWSPVTISSSTTFDGRGHKISNLSLTASTTYVGFVSTNYGIIKNTTFLNIYLKNSSTSSAYTGGVAGYQSGTASKVQNCIINSGSVSGENADNDSNVRVGGIVGYLYSGTVENCTNYATISTGKQIGGIVGYAYTSATITNCFNFGSVSTNNYRDSRVGGIVGEVYSSNVIKLCNNKGSVSGYLKSSSSYSAMVGGIAGKSASKISKCYNYGNVYAGGTSSYESYAGGIVGSSSEVIEYCGNRGTIDADATEKTVSVSPPTPSDTVKFADNVGLFWAYDLYIAKGTYTDSGGSGNYKSTSYSSSGNYKERLAYTGGIVGKTTNQVKYSHNLGYIYKDYSYRNYNYTLYFKWKANREYHLLLTHTINFGYAIYSGSIVGQSSSSLSYCYALDTNKITNNYSFYARQLLANGSNTQDRSISSWGSLNPKLGSLGSAVFNTYHGINASGISSIKFTVKYEGDAITEPQAQYYTLDTGLTSTSYTDRATSFLTNSNFKNSSYLGNLGGTSTWGINTEINDGYPYIKELYF